MKQKNDHILLASILVALMSAISPAYPDNKPHVLIEQSPNGRYVFDVTLHTLPEIEALLDRAEKLNAASKSKRSSPDSAGIALVLHGDEIKLFDKKYYKENKKIVDKAARLDANKVIDIKICSTKLKELGMKKKDIPPFIETVPYGPDEIERLRSRGYLYL